MRCPHCDAAIRDDEAAFCPRCGKSLGAQEAEATTELRVPERVEPTTQSLSPEAASGVEEPQAPAPSLLDGFISSVTASLRRGAWVPLTAAAAFGFLAMVASAALLILGVKMQYPDIGSGSDPLGVLSGLIVVALGVLRVPLHIGDLTVSALPLGALAAVGYLTVWATARALRPRAQVDARTAVAEGMKLAVPFALMCFVSALVFRIRTDPTPVAADAAAALVHGALWGLVFGGVGGLLAHGTFRSQGKALLEALRKRWAFIYHGLVAGGVMLAASLILSAAAALLWVVVALLGGGPENFGLGEAGAAVIYLVAFGPNVVISILAIALGAPVEIGAQVSSAGRLVGPLTEVSLFDWGGGSPPWFAFLLLGVPVVACLAGGFAGYRSASRSEDKVSDLLLPVIIVAAATYAFALFELAALSEARLGAGLIRNRGFGRVAPDAATVLTLSFCWAFVMGLAGWKLGESGAASEEGKAETAKPGELPPVS